MKTAVFSFLLYLFAALGVTCGSHRLWAHRTFKASKTMRFLCMLMNLFTNQGSIFHWVRDHRLHHAYVDTERDPHDGTKGFWWSHCGWLFYQKSSIVRDAGRNIYMEDIKQDQFVMWQHRNYKWAAPLCCFGIPTALCSLWGDAMGGYFVAGALRYVLSLHATWFVNSIAHMWGYRPYLPNIRPTENLFVSLCAVGEGWHNYHHAYPYDYSANEYGVLQWNPTTLFINIMAAFGHVTDRRRAVIPKGDSALPIESLPRMTLNEVETLGKQQACMLAVDGIVYDLSTFEDSHPAGATILREWYGKDASEAFNGKVHAHTEVAINMMKPYRIARLVAK